MDLDSLQSARTRNHAVGRKSRPILLGRSYSSFVFEILKKKIKFVFFNRPLRRFQVSMTCFIDHIM